MNLTVAAWIVLFLSLIALWIKKRRERLSIFKLNGIPGPDPSFWTGNLKEFSEKREDGIEDLVKRYGKICGIFIGMKPFLIVTDPELIKLIQVKEFGKFMDRDPILRDAAVPQPITMKAMAARRGDEWRKHRAFLSPLFSTSKLKGIMPIINEAGDIFMEKAEKARREGSVNIIKIVRNLSLDIMTKAALGIDTRVQHGGSSKLLNSAELFLSLDVTDILPAISLCFPELEPIPTKLRNIKDSLKYILGFPSVKKLYASVQEVVNYRRKTSQRQEDILQALMEEKSETKRLQGVRDEELVASNENKENGSSAKNDKKTPSNAGSNFSLSDEAIVANAVVFLVAGTDTTSAAISHAAFHLSKNEEIQEMVREEINNVLGEKESIGYDDIAKLSYLDQVVSETLRLNPVGPITINRIALESLHYKDLTIPAGVTVTFPPSYLHKNPEYWTDPEKFDPERFSSENKGKINATEYQPFGSGPRNCLGMRLGQTVVRYVLARLVRSYKIKSCDQDVRKNRAMILDQLQELMVKLEPITP